MQIILGTEFVNYNNETDDKARNDINIDMEQAFDVKNMCVDWDTETMWDTDKDPLFISISAVVGDLSLKIFQDIQSHWFYKCIETIQPNSKLSSYFRRIIALEIYPFVADMMIKRRKNRRSEALFPSAGIYQLLCKYWPANYTPLTIKMTLMLRWFLSIKRICIKLIKRIRSYCFGLLTRDHSLNLNLKNVIAVQYNEGLNLKKRSDIAWLSKSGIAPSRILIYFDAPDAITRKPVAKEVLEKIESLGMNWVSLTEKATEFKSARYWKPHSKRREKQQLNKPEDAIGKWIYDKYIELQKTVDYWTEFYIDFQVKFLVLNEQGTIRSIAQSIAFDSLGANSGFTLGRQRSDIGAPIKTYVGHHTKDIQFVWNMKIRKYLLPPYNQVRTALVAGYSYDAIFDKNDPEILATKNQLNNKGAKFIIALFDSGHDRKIGYSTADLENLYQIFLEWVLQDASVGLVIKSKKPHIIQNLPTLHSLFAKSESTGRCIRLANEFGRLASDASRVADIAVGFGINSAVTEAVIGGCRGIHYLKQYPREQDYFKWGLGKIVFNDLNDMISMLKKYKDDPASNPQLGDWSLYLDKLDPFRDGRGGERMGTYMRWCLEGFESGLSRDEVLKRANHKYQEKWGRDKVIYCE